MSATLSRTLVLACLRFACLPSLPPPVVAPAAVPERRLDFLRWLAEHRPGVFRG
jgi:hypothetical protein